MAIHQFKKRGCNVTAGRKYAEEELTLLRSLFELQDSAMLRHVKQQVDADSKMIQLDGFDPQKVMSWWFWVTKSPEDIQKEFKLMEQGLKEFAKLLVAYSYDRARTISQ